MSKGKLQKFAEYNAFPFTFDYTNNTKGQWRNFFGNNNPIVLELACGKGDYAVGLAKLYPEKNFIGVDIKGNRMWKGATIANELKLKNIAFLRIEINNIEDFFDAQEVAEFWITFADPQPKKEKKRLTHPKFLTHYQRIGSQNCIVNLKCDSDLLYQFTKEVIAQNQLEILQDISDVYALENIPEILQIKTFYEQMWLTENRTIKYLQFVLNYKTLAYTKPEIKLEYSY